MIDIVLPVYNRPKHTKQTIDSLYLNTDSDFNLIVVDDCSDDETKDLLETLKLAYDFQLIRNQENLGPGGSKNNGATSLKRKYRYLYFSDNDVYFNKGWLHTLLKLYQLVAPQKIALLGASCHPYLRDYRQIKIGNFTIGIKDAVSGYSQLTTWEIFNRFGPMDTQEGMDKKTGRSDDWAFCQRIKEVGFEVGSVEPELIIPTGKSDSYGDMAVGADTFLEHEGVFIQ